MSFPNILDIQSRTFGMGEVNRGNIEKDLNGELFGEMYRREIF